MAWTSALADRWWLLRHADEVRAGRRPRHVGIVMDGNGRWARAAGHLGTSVGHRAGAEHLEDFLSWCSAWDVEHVTAYVLSADNIRKRSGSEVQHLYSLLETTVPDLMARPDLPWRLHVSGDVSLLPASTREVLTTAVAETAERPSHLTLAIGYDGRKDIVEGLRRSVLALHAGGPPDAFSGYPSVDDISRALPGGPVKDIDLVIRTSGERRLSGFFPWQSSGAEIFMCDKLWPAFTEADFVRALAFYAARRPAGGLAG